MVNNLKSQIRNPQSMDVAAILHRQTSTALFSFKLQLIQHAPWDCLTRLTTGAGRLIQIGPALDAQSPARLRTHKIHRKSEENSFADIGGQVY